MNSDIISEIELLYQELPEIGCKQCGQCCVSPTCTLAEFIYLFQFLHKNLAPERIKQYLLAPAEIHPDYEGNLCCIFLEKGKCAVHPGRTGACRLFGIPSLKELKLTNMEDCKNEVAIIKGNGNVTFVQSWLDRLYILEKKLYRSWEEPYFIKGFNIECWLDIYFDDSLDFDVFIEIKNSMNQYIDFVPFKKFYRPKTGLKEKIDKISILAALLDSGDQEAIKKVLLSIRNDYSLTGMYFYDESEAFLKILDKSG